MVPMLASWGSRAGALLVDGVVVFIISVILELIIHSGGGASPFSESNHGHIVWSYQIATIIFSVLYYLITMTRSGEHNGQTLGKQASNIRVARDDGQSVGVSTVLARELLFKQILGGITFGLFSLFDYLWPLSDKENRAIHDHGCKTHVVKV
jgi:uncharacterized RDD family membrane protein YckC